jgi:hypothetical protein
MSARTICDVEEEEEEEEEWAGRIPVLGGINGSVAICRSILARARGWTHRTCPAPHQPTTNRAPHALTTSPPPPRHSLRVTVDANRARVPGVGLVPLLAHPRDAAGDGPRGPPLPHGRAAGVVRAHECV